MTFAQCDFQGRLPVAQTAVQNALESEGVVFLFLVTVFFGQQVTQRVVKRTYDFCPSL